MKNKKILIRTAGGKAKGKELGLGHIFRTCNLAKEISHHEIFFLVEDYGGASEIIQNNGFLNIILLKTNLSSKDDFLQTKKIILEKNIDLVIFDKYKIDKNYVQKIRSFSKTMVISDLNNINYSSDVLINGFVGFSNKIMKKNQTTMYLGPKYQILNKKFKVINRKKIQSHKKIKLLITVGGYDENNLINILIDEFSNYFENFSIKIILGPLTKLNSKLKKLSEKYPSNIKIIHSTFDMKKEISNCDFGICSGGITSYEFATLRKPFAIICQSPHQVLTAKKWENLGMGQNLGVPNRKTKQKISKLIESLTSNKPKVSRIPAYFDGKGAERVSKKVNMLLRT